MFIENYKWHLQGIDLEGMTNQLTVHSEEYGLPEKSWHLTPIKQYSNSQNKLLYHSSDQILDCDVWEQGHWSSSSWNTEGKHDRFTNDGLQQNGCKKQEETPSSV